MPHLAPRPWVPAACEALIQRQATETAAASDRVAARIERLITRNADIHDRCLLYTSPSPRD